MVMTEGVMINYIDVGDRGVVDDGRVEEKHEVSALGREIKNGCWRRRGSNGGEGGGGTSEDKK